MSPQTYHSTENYDWQVSHHACQRWCERVDNTSSTWAARILIQIAMQNHLLIPNRYATTRWVEKHIPSKTLRNRLHGIRYHLAGTVIAITAGNRVITVIKATDEDYATLLVWLTFGIWFEKDDAEVQGIHPPA